MLCLNLKHVMKLYIPVILQNAGYRGQKRSVSQVAIIVLVSLTDTKTQRSNSVNDNEGD